MEKFWWRKKDISHISYYVNVAFIIGLFIVLISIVYFGANPQFSEYREGDVALKDIFAPYDFTYKGDLDEDKIREAKEDIIKKIPTIYEIDEGVNFNVKNDFAKFINKTEDLRKKTDIEEKEKINSLKTEFSKNISDDSLRILLTTDKFEAIKSICDKLINEVLSLGLLKDSDKDSLQKNSSNIIILFDAKTNLAKEMPIAAIFTKESVDKKIIDTLAPDDTFDKKVKSAITETLNAFLLTNLNISQAETKKAQDEAIKAMPAIYKEILVKKNETIIQKGTRITKAHLVKLSDISKKDTIYVVISYLGGVAFLLAIFMIITIIYLVLYEQKILADFKNLYLIALIILLMVTMTKLIIISPWPSYFIPIASGSILLAILLNSNIAFIITIMLSIFTGIIGGDQFGITIATMVGGVVGIYSVSKVRRRSQILKAGFFVGIANFMTIVGIGFLHGLIFLREGLWGFASGITSAVIVMGFLPLFEYIFKISTNITLLELSDLNHPLLRQLVLKAPGTYHHSIIVGNLAEEACEAIGANSLLARVGAYYHDIGKLEKAEYFSENQPDTITSHHEKLKPSMSSLVITNHVKDGVDLAKKYNLNKKITDFIEQHHGTGLVYYFYKKALEKIEDDAKIKEDDFRYPGPKPQSKETAIVLLADSVEAASRAITNPTPVRIKEQVQRIINNKFIDGQLDDCDLTLKDLHKISNSFERILTGMFHTRVHYPEAEEGRENIDFEG